MTELPAPGPAEEGLAKILRTSTTLDFLTVQDVRTTRALAFLARKIDEPATALLEDSGNIGYKATVEYQAMVDDLRQKTQQIEVLRSSLAIERQLTAKADARCKEHKLRRAADVDQTRADEREACAKVAEEYSDAHHAAPTPFGSLHAQFSPMKGWIADAIRNRGK